MEAACWSSHGHENHGGGNWLHSAAEIQLTPNSPVAGLRNIQHQSYAQVD